ncbi:hypothetical protein G7A72_03215 [Flavobacterium sp. Sr18]|uniref:hypothetical protein n=1 Tax=Flavobacterium sp. Sr18 TaxID=935222 RepID=UPI0013E4CBBC|nr:hypothetical protein [Flavobacterium sp. Sr18]QIH37869.1 hypothetical protein G7A72_03215 [Flavobacterium sp. Sr18]
MVQHTLVLTTPKIIIPSTEILEFVKELILSNLINIDYFGIELDNQADYVDDEMQLKFDTSTYITFHFEDTEIDYVILDEDNVLNLIFNQLNNNKIGEIIVDEKNIEIYIYK